MARARVLRAITEGKPLRALVYARASADKAKSVEDQADECIEFCGEEGFEIVEVLRENERSASRYATKERPEYEKALAMLRAGEVDVLCTWENSRAQRDLGVYVELRAICEACDVLWAYGGEVYDMHDPTDRQATAQDAVRAEAESDNISVRVARGVRRRAKAGLWHGVLQYGYKREYDPETGAVLRQVIDPKTSKIVREIVDRLLAGHSVTSIVNDFNARGVPCPHQGVWGASKVRHLALNPVVAGKRVHKGVVIGDGQWPNYTVRLPGWTEPRTMRFSVRTAPDGLHGRSDKGEFMATDTPNGGETGDRETHIGRLVRKYANGKSIREIERTYGLSNGSLSRYASPSWDATELSLTVINRFVTVLNAPIEEVSAAFARDIELPLEGRTLTADEEELLDCYAAIPAELRPAIRKMIKALSEELTSAPATKATS